jgi:hypothetical protein
MEFLYVYTRAVFIWCRAQELSRNFDADLDRKIWKRFLDTDDVEASLPEGNLVSSCSKRGVKRKREDAVVRLPSVPHVCSPDCLVNVDVLYGVFVCALTWDVHICSAAECHQQLAHTQTLTEFACPLTSISEECIMPEFGTDPEYYARLDGKFKGKEAKNTRRKKHADSTLAYDVATDLQRELGTHGEIPSNEQRRAVDMMGEWIQPALKSSSKHPWSRNMLRALLYVYFRQSDKWAAKFPNDATIQNEVKFVESLIPVQSPWHKATRKKDRTAPKTIASSYFSFGDLSDGSFL